MNASAAARIVPMDADVERPSQPDRLVGYICSHVFAGTRPVLLVVREHGDWMFTCGSTDHGTNDCHLGGVGDLVAQDPTLNECLDLPEGFEDERSWVGVSWLRRKANAAIFGLAETETEADSQQEEAVPEQGG